MRPFAVFPALCALAALILSLLCLFAGTSKGFLPDAQLVTVNASRLGHGELFNTSDGDGSLISDLGNLIEGGINSLAGDAVNDIAKAIGMHDFYKVHVMNYCEGFYEPNDTAKHAKQNITFCSKRNPAFHFNLTGTVESELIESTSLIDIHWPDEITTDLKMLKVTTKAMLVFYCLAIAFAGLSFLASLLGVFGGGRLSAFGNFLLFSLGFISIGLASALATAVIVKTDRVINRQGSRIGLSASKGTTFLGLTWAATGVMGLGAIVWIFECIVGRRRRRTYVEKT